MAQKVISIGGQMVTNAYDFSIQATSKTKSQAQAIVDADISGSYYTQGPDSGSQVVVTLP